VAFIPLDFPREVLEITSNGGRGWRRLVKSSEELERYWRGKSGSGNVYFTAYGFTNTEAPKHHRVDYNTPKIHHFIMDFDCKDFKSNGKDVPFDIPHKEVTKLHKMLLEKNVLHFVWFSGGGFHVWIPISKTLNPKNGNELSRIKYSGRLLINKWDKKLGGLRCNDPTVAFDTSGMIRIPNSYNAKRECWSVPLESKEIIEGDYDYFMDKAQEASSGYIPIGSNTLEFEVIKNRFMNVNDIKPVYIPPVSFENLHILPCLAQAALGEGNPIHRARYHLASYLADRLRMFFPAIRISDEEKKKHVKQISNFCASQGWVDYKKEKTIEQVESIVTKGYPHASCSTLYTEGFCIGKCQYYDGSMGVE